MPTNRQNTIVLRVSNVTGKTPTIANLILGEVAVNTADAKMYSLYTGGASAATEVRQIGWDRLSTTGGTISGTVIATTISATTFSGGTFFGNGSGLTNVTATALNIYNSDGTLTGNRIAGLSSFTLNFSSATQPNTLVMSGGNVGIGTSTPLFKLDVNGNINLPTSTASTYGTITQTGSTLLQTYGLSNLFLGINAGNFTMTGTGQNVGIGTNSFVTNITGSKNTGVGYNTLNANSVGANNTAVGNSALQANTSGNSNTALGQSALSTNTRGSSNTAIGLLALSNNLTGSNNVAIGQQALLNNQNNSNNVAIGIAALINNVVDGNTAIGSNSLASNTSGTSNTGIGNLTLNLNTTGSTNTAIGNSALQANTTGSSNTAIGASSLGLLTFGSLNTGVGYQALGSNTTGSSNTAIGSNALINNSIGANNTAIGANALQTNTTGTTNVAIGYQALNNNISGSSNVAIGPNAGFNELGNNKLYIANASTGALIYGDFTAKTIGINTPITALTNTLTVSGTTDPLKLIGLQSASDAFFLTVDGSGVLHTAPKFSPGVVITAVTLTGNVLTVTQAGGAPTASTVNAVTGGTFSGGTLSLSGTGNIGLSITGLTSADTFTTAATYNINTSSIVFTRNNNTTYTASNITSIYSSDNTIISNRTVGLSSFTLNFSSATQADTISISSGNVGIGVLSPTTKLDVKGNINFPTTSATTFGVISQNGSSLLHTIGTNNLFLGASAGNFNITGTGQNVGIGVNSLKLNSGGTNNTAIGYNTLPNNQGNSNTAVGSGTLSNVTTGNSNTAVGVSALASLVTGSSNTAVGINALTNNQFGDSNTAVGTNSLQNNTAASNTAVGNNSLASNTSGTSNTAIGNFSLRLNTTGGSNTSIGTFSLQKNTFGNSNTAIGLNALANNLTGSSNTAIGVGAIGNLTSGTANIGIGGSALSQNTSGTSNVAIGGNALQNNISGFSNVAIGNAAGGNELGDNKLYIANTNTSFPLISGDFTGKSVGINVHVSALTNTLVVSAASVDPVKFIGLQNANDPSVVTTDASGVLHKIAMSTVTGGSASQIVISTAVTFVTNLLTITNSTGGTVSTLINSFSALTVNGLLSANTIQAGSVSATTFSGGTFFGNASGLTNFIGIPVITNTAATFTNNLLTITNSTGGTVSTFINNFSALTVNGLLSANTITAGSVSATTFSGGTFFGNGSGLTNVVATTTNIYNTDGTLTGNRIVGLSSFTLNFSSATQPDTLVMSGGNVGINTNTPAFDLDVKGSLNFGATTASTFGVLNQNAISFLHSYGTNNLFLGANAGNFTMTGSGGNLGIGASSLAANSGGTNNTAVGLQTLQNNVTGINNTAFGSTALQKNTTGNNNMAFGQGSLTNNTTGSSNTAMGSFSLNANISGTSNTAVGSSALQKMISGSSNTAIGVNSSNANISGSNNTTIGLQSLLSNTGGSFNTIIGMNSFLSNLTGSSNVSLGYQAGQSESGSNKLYIANNNSNTLIYGDFAVGGVGINATTFDPLGPETLVISAVSTTSYNMIATHGVVNNYFQINNTNLSSGNNASTDFVATNNIGNENNFYSNFGINNSGYTTNYIGTANDGYLFTLGRELWVGSSTTGATGNVRFFAGNSGTTTNMLLSGLTGNLGVGSTLPTNRLTVSAATDPVKFVGLQTGTDGTLLTTDATGVIHTIAMSTLSGVSATTIYTKDGNIIGNRIVGLTSNTLTFSSTTQPNLLVMSGSNVGIGTTSPAAPLTVSAASNPMMVIGLTAATTEANMVSVDSTGVFHTMPISQVLLTGGSVNNVTGLTISLASWYNKYPTLDIVLSNVVPVTQGAVLISRLGANVNGFSSNTNSHRWTHSSLSDTGTTNVNATQSAATGMSLCYSATTGSANTVSLYGLSNKTAQGWNGTLKLYSASATTAQTQVSIQAIYWNNFNSFTTGFGGGSAVATGATQAIQFFFSTGNTSAATFRVIGYL